MSSSFRKMMALILCAAMLSTMGVTAFAANPSEALDVMEIKVPIEEQTISGVMLQQDYPEISMPDKTAFVSSEIDVQTISQDIAVVDDNQPPVADLRATVLNPESMIDGNFTTETQIAWLWSYDGEDFTYDPDGDEIINRSIGGITQNDILGTLVGGIGFVTQFQTAAQYHLTFQVQDARGAWSNVAKYVFNIEPADGNTRPVCRIGFSSDTLYVDQVMLLSWEYSYDSDPEDSLTSLQGMVVADDGTSSDLSNYIVQSDNTTCAIRFPKAGSYEIWIRICDSHNAWSNWVILTVTVEDVNYNVSVEGTIEEIPSRGYWVDNYRAQKIDQGVKSNAEAVELAEICGSHIYPGALPEKMLFDSSINVTGRLTTASGTPLANKEVTIRMPVAYKKCLEKTVYTDTNGNFSYTPTAARFWVDIGFYTSESGVDFMHVGDYTGKYTQYTYFSNELGTSFFYPTTISVHMDGHVIYSEDVACEIGYSSYPIIGNSICQKGEWTLTDWS